jgi:16S rRNA (cytosine1402-N4)-methyltransferase
MQQEVIEGLAVQPGGRYIDCTAGTGGHSGAILKYSSPGGQLLGIDADPSAVEMARKRLSGYGSSVVIENDNFVNLEKVCAKYDFMPVHGILLDLGLSSLQLNDNGRGFSFQYAAPLDMRFNPEQKITAADIVNKYSEAELARIIRDYGEEPAGNRIARLIINERPVSTTIELAKIVEQASGFKRGRIHPATRTFQALRIAVNNELEHLESTLKQAVNLLGYEGRLVVITYHSLEDRIVKQFMQREAKDCICPPEVPVCRCHHAASLKLINKKVITDRKSVV